MASVSHYLQEIPCLQNEVIIREALKDCLGRKEFRAARLLQAVWRGHMIRIRVEYWHVQATIVQKHFRGYLGRKLYRDKLMEAVIEMCWEWYNKMATRIESLYRGFASRKSVFDFYAMKRWIETVKSKNLELKQAIEKERIASDQETAEQVEEDARKWVLFIAFKLHHLLRTKEIAGVYSLNYTIELSKFEKLLKSVKYTKYIKILHEKYKKHMECLSETRPPIFTCHRRCMEEEALFYTRNKDNDKDTFSKTPKPLVCRKNFKVKPDFNLCRHKTQPPHQRDMFKQEPYNPIRNVAHRDCHPDMFLDGEFDLNVRTISKEMLNYIEYHIDELQKQRCSVHYTTTYENNRCMKRKEDC